MDQNKWLALVLFASHFASLPCKQFQCIYKSQTGFFVLKSCIKCRGQNKLCYKKLDDGIREGSLLKMTDRDGNYHLRIGKSFYNKRNVCVLNGTLDLGVTCCSAAVNSSIHCFKKKETCKAPRDETEENCERLFKGKLGKSFYFIKINKTSTQCYICKNKGMVPAEEISENLDDGEENDPAKAVELMNRLGSFLSNMNESSARVSIGATKGVIVKQDEQEIDEIREVSVGYGCGENNDMLTADDEEFLSTCAGSVLISKEAFENAYNKTNVPFAGIFRFNNMDKDEMNSSVLLNQVIAIDMGTAITNLNHRIKINFRNVTEEGIPSCRSWNGEGSLPTWTENGCDTKVTGDNISCLCSHLTFFAVIMSPLNKTTISAADLKSLNYITYIGCGLSIFFLGIAFFMHFVTRRTKASKSKDILIQLMIALFLLNLSFLTNKYVANLHSTEGCQAMAAFMHYSMLATFTWFAMNAFHLWQNFCYGDNISIQRYILKVSVTAWAIPIVLVVTLLILGKYGELAIPSDGHDTTICWMKDDKIQYIINIPFYAVVFLFTFSTLIVILSWLCMTKTSRAVNVQKGRSRAGIWSVFGLCCTLGVTWGIAFFAHGALRLPSYYIFTILNSLQGFFLFLYYYKTSQMVAEVKTSDSSSQKMTDVTE